MNTLEAIAKRKSTRNYTPEQIPEEALEVILKAGSAAPVAMAKYDSLHITVVQTQQLLDKINQATEEVFFRLLGERRNMDFGAKTLLFVSSKELFGINYSKTKYVLSSKKVIITCPIHGDFEQTPNHHLGGEGCPVCKQSKGERLVENILLKYHIPFKREVTFHVDEIVKNRKEFRKTNLIKLI